MSKAIFPFLLCCNRYPLHLLSPQREHALSSLLYSANLCSGEVTQAEFRDGDTLVTSSTDGSIKVWDVSTGASRDEADGDHFDFCKAGTERRVGCFLIKADGELVLVHDVVDDSREKKTTVAFFRAPSPVSAIDCAGENIAVGCISGAVLHLRAAWLATK